jgi:hypothetical protein
MNQQQLKKILKSKKIYDLKKDVRLMKRKEFLKYFATKKNRIILSRLIKNIIWQAYTRIKDGSEKPIDGNIRTFWYLWVKPVLSHMEDDDKVKTDPYHTMSSAFTEMIMDLRLFNYSDFGFTDENWENRRIGEKHPEIIVFSEKRGWFRFLRQIHKELDVSVLALGGIPSALTSEYTATHIKNKLKTHKQNILLIGIVDYDPSGDIISHSFQKQLAVFGLNHSNLITIVNPKHYTQQKIDMFKFQLPKRQKTKTKKWITKTNGINGELYGLESESMPKNLIQKLITDIVLKEIASKP